MPFPLLSSEGNLTDPSEAFSIASLLECGIQCAQQGSYAEGVVFFALVRQQLTPDQAHVAAALDGIIRSNANYWQAQQMLHLASKRFAEADSEQKTLLADIQKLLPTLSEKANQVAQSHCIPELPQPTGSQLQQPQKSPNSQSVESRPSSLNDSELPAPSLLHKAGDPLPNLYITCFGHFEVRQFDRAIPLCQNRSGQAILRYLVAQPKYCASRDTLMDVLWPDDPPEVARRKLQIAVSALRCSLNNGYSCDPGGGYILYKDQFYLLNPAVTIHTDVDEFLSLWRAGRSASRKEAIGLFEKASRLYTDPFMVEDMYADWSSAKREKLSQIYMSMCHTMASYYLENGRYEDALKWASEILKEDRCDEEAHRKLMRIYSAQGQRSEALRQFQRCKGILAEELGVAPTLETMNVLQTLLTNMCSPADKMSENRAKIE
ncbi:MAG: BTAD domain-containing putative transcriptional regulator [Ktedonobacteraceae bacterium]